MPVRVATIAQQRARLEKRLAKLQQPIRKLLVVLAELQKECEHAFVVKTPHSNCGYDYENYWYDCECTDCGKVWCEDQ